MPKINRVKPYLQEYDNSLPWLYRPRTVTGLSLIICVVCYVSFFLSPPSAFNTEIARHALQLRGIGCLCLVFLGYCALQLRDSLLIRPHPGVWRIIHGIGLLYLLGIVYLLVFPANDARLILRGILLEVDPITNAPLKIVNPPSHNSHSYGEDCRIYTPGDPGGNFARVLESIDIFFLSHLLGWFMKALFLRDWRLAWVLSLSWELLEYSFQNILPNFIECWWDHWIEDFLLCNGLGLWLGMLTVNYLNVLKFDWTGTNRIDPLPQDPFSQLTLLLRQFTPYEFARYEWRLFDRPENFVAVCLLIFGMAIIELNTFFLKFVLYLPPSHPLNVWRLALWLLLSIPATHEYYDYVVLITANTKSLQEKDELTIVSSTAISRIDITSVKQRRGSVKSLVTPSVSLQQHISTKPLEKVYHRIGPNLWLAIGISIAETLISIKFSQETRFKYGFPKEYSLLRYIPTTVIFCWTIAVSSLLIWTVLKFGGLDRFFVLKGNYRKICMNALIAVLCFSLAYLAFSQDVGIGLNPPTSLD
jgi:phosphatidylserine synthase 2